MRNTKSGVRFEDPRKEWKYVPTRALCDHQPLLSESSLMCDLTFSVALLRCLNSCGSLNVWWHRWKHSGVLLVQGHVVSHTAKGEMTALLHTSMYRHVRECMGTRVCAHTHHTYTQRNKCNKSISFFKKKCFWFFFYLGHIWLLVRFSSRKPTFWREFCTWYLQVSDHGKYEQNVSSLSLSFSVDF